MLRICEKRVSLLNTRNAYQFERVRSLRLESHFDINFKDRGVESRKKLKICGEDFRFWTKYSWCISIRACKIDLESHIDRYQF